MTAKLPIVLAAALLWAPVTAQEHKPSLSGCHAIVGVTLIKSPGDVVEGATIVIRDGLITAADRGVSVPDDAEVLDGGTLTVTAGFTAVGPELGAAPPSPERKQPDDVTAAPHDRGRMGMTPQRRVGHALKAEEDPLPGKPWLKQGVTSLIVHPKGRLVPGTAAVVSTAPGPGPDRLIKEDAGVVLTFSGGRGSYPGSLMGMVAAIRQMFLDADRLKTWRSRFEANPRGIPSPPYQEDLLAVIPTLGGQAPTLFHCNRSGDVRRALNISREFDLRPWVRGGADLGKSVDRVATAKAVALLEVPVKKPAYKANQQWLEDGLSADAPAARDDSDERPVAVKESRGTETPAPTTEDVYIQEARALRVTKEREDLRPHVTAGAALADRGVPLLMAASKPDRFMDHVRTQVRFGLAHDHGLASLTTGPAAAVGLGRSMGRVEAGFRADLVVTRGHPLEDGVVAHVFCRGERFDLPVKKKKGAPDADGEQPDGSPLVGKWTVEVEGRQSGDATLTIEQGDDGLSGVYETGFGEGQVQSVEVKDDDVTIVCTFSREEFEMEITFEGTLSKDRKTVEGEMKLGQFGARPFKATKGGE